MPTSKKTPTYYVARIDNTEQKIATDVGASIKKIREDLGVSIVRSKKNAYTYVYATATDFGNTMNVPLSREEMTRLRRSVSAKLGVGVTQRTINDNHHYR